VAHVTVADTQKLEISLIALDSAKKGIQLIFDDEFAFLLRSPHAKQLTISPSVEDARNQIGQDLPPFARICLGPVAIQFYQSEELEWIAAYEKLYRFVVYS
jgi:hypothetical protein